MTDATNHAKLLYKPVDSLYNDEHTTFGGEFKLTD